MRTAPTETFPLASTFQVNLALHSLSSTERFLGVISCFGAILIKTYDSRTHNQKIDMLSNTLADNWLPLYLLVINFRNDDHDNNDCHNSFSNAGVFNKKTLQEPTLSFNTERKKLTYSETNDIEFYFSSLNVSRSQICLV